jgi:hypothetical protein
MSLLSTKRMTERFTLTPQVFNNVKAAGLLWLPKIVPYEELADGRYVIAAKNAIHGSLAASGPEFSLDLIVGYKPQVIQGKDVRNIPCRFLDGQLAQEYLKGALTVFDLPDDYPYQEYFLVLPDKHNPLFTAMGDAGILEGKPYLTVHDHELERVAHQYINAFKNL